MCRHRAMSCHAILCHVLPCSARNPVSGVARVGRIRSVCSVGRVCNGRRMRTGTVGGRQSSPAAGRVLHYEGKGGGVASAIVLLNDFLEECVSCTLPQAKASHEQSV